MRAALARRDEVVVDVSDDRGVVTWILEARRAGAYPGAVGRQAIGAEDELLRDEAWLREDPLGRVV
jgi:hypothetical protein